MTSVRYIIVAVLLMVALAITRFMPGEAMPLNFSAVYALAFCAGVYFPGRMAWWLPLGALLVTDFVLSKFIYSYPFFHPSLIGNYAAYVGLIWLGRRIGRKAAWWKLVGGGILGALLFYLVTNTISWIWNPVYPKTLAGLIQALTTGEPGWPHTWMFFRSTLLSGGLFTGLFAGVMKVFERFEAAPDEEEADAPEESGDLEPEESKA